jgi:hypothetical protein
MVPCQSLNAAHSNLPVHIEQLHKLMRVTTNAASKPVEPAEPINTEAAPSMSTVNLRHVIVTAHVTPNHCET